MSFDEVKALVLGGEPYGGEAAPAEAAARQACLEVAYAIFALTDFGRAAGTLELYADSIVMDIDGLRMDRAARVERSRKREADTARRTRHLISNFLFRMSDERTAHALSLVTIFHEDDRGAQGVTPLAVADCADRFERRADGRWQVTYRCLKTVAGAAH